MLATLLLRVCLLSLNQDIHWREGTTLVMLDKTASTSMLTLFESSYVFKGMYNIGNGSKTASTSMLTLFESRYTLKGRYNIGNVGKTASMSMLTLFESSYVFKGMYNNIGIMLPKLCLLARYTFNNQPVKVSARQGVYVTRKCKTFHKHWEKKSCQLVRHLKLVLWENYSLNL